MIILHKRLLIIGMSLLALLCLGNQLEYYLRAGRQAHPQVMVRAESNALGHRSIGIDEVAMGGNGGQRMLFFSTLGNWDFAARHRTPCPPAIQALSGQTVNCVGFMYPLQPGDQVKVFCLLRSTQTCCYGPRPQYNQYLLVESATPVHFMRFAPIIVRGKFFVDPQPDQGYIYRMEAVSVERAADEPPEINAEVAAKQAKLPLFSYLPLGGLGHEHTAIPTALHALDGRRVVLSGYCVRHTKETPPRVIVEKEWWDGVANGIPPALDNAVLVTPRDDRQMPSLWQTHVVMTGTLRITANPADWSAQGIVRLEDAVLSVPGASNRFLFADGGPCFSPWEEAVLALLLVLCSVRLRKASRPTEEGMTDA